ncbi:MAG: hypothetical protein H7Y13_15910 [Sphingobacteriaceae bacterium]|nr:hypothetical protein [Sphingobacteriaceae bacterium]
MKNMHSVSDDDFDQLFQDKLYLHEVEPTDAVWAGIKEQLPALRKVRNFPILRLAAASMAAVIGLGIWLAKTKEPIRLSGNSEIEIEQAPVASKIAGAEVMTIPRSKVLSTTPDRMMLTKALEEQPQKTAKLSSPAGKVVPEFSVDKNNITDESKLTLAIKDENETPGIETVVSDNSSHLALVSEDDTEIPEEFQKPKKIRSVGSLVNFVVSKVDKRKNKIIEFVDSDEGTMVSGVNLGLVKFGTKEKNSNHN